MFNIKFKIKCAICNKLRDIAKRSFMTRYSKLPEAPPEEMPFILRDQAI